MAPILRGTDEMTTFEKTRFLLTYLVSGGLSTHAPKPPRGEEDS